MDATTMTKDSSLANTAEQTEGKTPRLPGMAGHYQASITGAGLDNLFRQVAGVALVTVAMKAHPADPAKAEALGNLYTNLSALLFIAPFLLLGPLAGSLGDRVAKHHIIRTTRLAEVALVIIGAIGLALGNVYLLLTTVAGLAIASAFFAPVKLSVIPELTTPQNLPTANAWVAAITVLAILGGTGLAALTGENLLTGTFLAPLAGAGMLLLLGLMLCAIGIHGAWRIGKLQPQAPDTPIAMPWALVGQIRALSSTKGLWAPSLALAGFWSLGAVAQITMMPLAANTYHLDQAGIAGLAVGLGLGLVAGALITPRLIAKAFPSGLPIHGAMLAALALLYAGYHAHNGGGIAGFATCMVLCGVGAGLWETPLTIILQERAPASIRNLVMAGAGVLASLGMLLAIGVSMSLTQILGFTSAQVFMALGGGGALLALLCAWIYRKQCAGWLTALITNTAYRVRVSGAENLPMTGGCLVVCNHPSYSDGLILGAHLPRPGRFLVYRGYVEAPVIGLFLRAAGVIPVAAEDSRRALLASIDTAIEAAKSGEVVVVFPEGKLTRSGQMDVFRSGIERIASRAGVPVVPAYLDGLWGTVTSRSKKWSFPRPRRPVSLRIGEPLPSTTTAAQARAHVMALSYESAQARSDRDQRTLAGVTLTNMRRHPLRPAIRDAGGVLSFWKLIAVARILAKRLALADDENRVGLLLPPGRGGAMANLALAFLGRTAVNLNHTVGQAQLKRMCDMAGIRTIISATPYLKRIGDPGLSVRMVQLDELMKTTSALSVIGAALGAFLLPNRVLVRAKADDVAAIIFSSGSTGDPKGVELTHRQVLANITAVAEGLELSGERDVLLSPLPLFHSFGLIPGFWLGLTLGMPSAAHPDPTDAKALGNLAQASGVTFLISTPTFVRGYLRRIEPEQFKTLRFAVVGAERCPPDLKQAFRDRYGAELLEGYGCTELAPTVALNLLPVKRDGVTEVRSRDGTVGRPLPGLHVFTIDPETHERLPAGREGLLVVQSPSRMRGYLDRPDLTEKAFLNGGYNTGDMGKIDDDGFIHITGRLARFAKIGGEMVPLDNVEQAVHQAVLTIVGADAAIEIAVASVTDEARGERLIVLHTGFTGDWEKLLASLEYLPALWRPRSRDVRQVEAIPKLGTGKRDLAGLKKLAAG